jgi:hypothetical protein
MASVTRGLVDLMDEDDLKSMMATLAKASALQPADYQDKFAALADSVEAQMVDYADRLAGMGMTPYQFRDAMLRTLRRAMADAFRYGIGAAGFPTILTDQDMFNIRQALSEDDAYLRRFTQELLRGDVPGYSPAPRGIIEPTGRWSVQERARMYANAIRAQFFSGLTSRGSPTQLWDWSLGATEHCGPCLDMAHNSPYTTVTLAGRMPGAGVCLGLDRCGCTLAPR